MPVNIKQLTINTKVNKKNNKEEKTQSSSSGSLSKFDKEVIVLECLVRVKEMIEYELKP